MTNKKVLFLKKIGMLVFETLKNKKSDFLNSNTCYTLYGIQKRLKLKYAMTLSIMHGKSTYELPFSSIIDSS